MWASCASLGMDGGNTYATCTRHVGTHQPQLGYGCAHDQNGGWVGGECGGARGVVGVTCVRLAFTFRVRASKLPDARKQSAGAQAYLGWCKHHMGGGDSIQLTWCGECRHHWGWLGMLGAGCKHTTGARKHTRCVAGVGASIRMVGVAY